MQQAKYPRFETTMWGDIPITSTSVEHQSLILQPIAPDTNNTIVLEVENLAGVTTLSVDGDGDLICKTITTGDSQTRTGLRNAIVGGSGNTVSVVDSFVTGVSNTINAGSQNSILGGGGNTISGASFNCSIVCGTANEITASNANDCMIAGWDNHITGTVCPASSIAGGTLHLINDSYYSAICGGYNNEITSSFAAVISGGEDNEASANHSTVSGGNQNHATDYYSTVGGGGDNHATGTSSVIVGGVGARAPNYGQNAFGGGSWFLTPGDSQVSEFLLRNRTTGAATYILYLDYPSNSHEITLGGSSWGVADIMLIATRVGANQSTAWRNTVCYTTSATGGGSIDVSMADPSPAPLFNVHTPSVMTAIPNISISVNNIFRINYSIAISQTTQTLAYVKLVHQIR